MIAVLLVVHTILVIALVGVVLMQRSEGGALGMGGGGGGMMSSRGAANVLTRTTSLLAAGFFATSILLALMADRGVTEQELLRNLTGDEAPASTDPFDVDSVDLDDMLDLGPDAPAEQQTDDVTLPEPSEGVTPADLAPGAEISGEEITDEGDAAPQR